MPTKTKSKSRKGTAKAGRTTARKTARIARSKTAVKNPKSRKILAKKKVVKTKPLANKTVAPKARRNAKKRLPRERTLKPVSFSFKKRPARSGRQSGDLQGLSRLAGADSESVA